MRYIIFIIVCVLTMSMNCIFAKEDNERKPIGEIHIKLEKGDMMLLCFNDMNGRQYSYFYKFSEKDNSDFEFQILPPAIEKIRGLKRYIIKGIINSHYKKNKPSSATVSTVAKIPFEYWVKEKMLNEIKDLDIFDISIEQNAKQGLSIYQTPILMLKNKPVVFEIFVSKDLHVLKALLPEKLTRERKTMDDIATR